MMKVRRSFYLDVDEGFQNIAKERLRINDIAWSLDRIEGIPEEAIPLLRELFEILGRRA